ncbi:MAG: hypothetical protein ACFFDP_08225 [Promethearchaeota archaeon]
MALRYSLNQLPIIFLLISLATLCLLPILTFYAPVAGQAIPYEKQVVGTIFSIICVLGILAGIVPSRCSQLFHFKRERKEPMKTSKATESLKPPIVTRGHHPTCGHYSTHVLQLGSTILCTGCTGLVIGGLIALVGSALFFFLGWTLPLIFVFYWFGFLCVVVGLLQHFLYKALKVLSGFVRIIVNAFFVIGVFFLLVTTVEITQFFALEVYLLLLIVYWIFTRIMMSKREHHLVCTECGDQACHLSKA